MPQLPTPGQDDGTWGTILNEFLLVAHNADGGLQSSAISAGGGITTSQVGTVNGVAALNGSGQVPVAQLASGTGTTDNFLRGDGTWAIPTLAGSAGGDLAGSYPNPTLTNSTNVESIISNNSTVTAKLNISTAASTYAPLASPALTGIPTAPTATAGTNTTQLATTAFVASAVTSGSASNATNSTTGLIQLDGDLGNSATSPEVVSTHLSSPLPTTQGGTGLDESSLAALLTALLAAGGGTMGAEITPKVVALTDATTIAVNAALGNDFRVQLGGNRTIGAPTNQTDGQRITIRIQQPSSGGPYTPSFASGTGGYSFGSASAPTWSTTASDVDITGWVYYADLSLWCFTGAGTGY